MMSLPTIEEVIKQEAIDRLYMFNHNRVQTAKSLGISKRTLRNWINKWYEKGEYSVQYDPGYSKLVGQRNAALRLLLGLSGGVEAEAGSKHCDSEHPEQSQS